MDRFEGLCFEVGAAVVVVVLVVAAVRAVQTMSSSSSRSPFSARNRQVKL
ncbi:hypothetical protein ABZ137_41180 [Streptomyces bobili]